MPPLYPVVRWVDRSSGDVQAAVGVDTCFVSPYFFGVLFGSPGSLSAFISSMFFASSLSESRSSAFLRTSAVNFFVLSSAMMWMRGGG